MVDITLHDSLGKLMGKSKWRLAVKSVSEAIHAINILTGGKLNKILKDLGQEKFEVKINNHLFKKTSLWENNLNKAETYNEIRDSELCFNYHKLERLDIVPVIRAADSDIFAIILGVILIIVGVVLSLYGGAGVSLIIAGIGLVAAGVMNLLAAPPKFDDFAEIDKGGKRSYLFNGPQNTIREGGPVPLGYGRALIGSQTISASYEINNIAVSDSDNDLIPLKNLILAFNIGGDKIEYFDAAKVLDKFIYKDAVTYASLYLYSPYGDPVFTTISNDINNDYISSGPKDLYKTSLISSKLATPLRMNINVGVIKDLVNYAGANFRIRLHFCNRNTSGVTNQYTITVGSQTAYISFSPLTGASAALGQSIVLDVDGVKCDSSLNIDVQILQSTGHFPTISAVEVYKLE